MSLLAASEGFGALLANFLQDFDCKRVNDVFAEFAKRVSSQISLEENINVLLLRRKDGPKKPKMEPRWPKLFWRPLGSQVSSEVELATEI